MSNKIGNFNNNQMDTLLKSMEKNKFPKEKMNLFDKKIENKAKQDFLDLASQVDIINQENSKVTKNYADLETKLGIDSSKWGVEAVSDNIFDFAKILYEKYKLTHSEEESQEMLDKFYDMAKNSITTGYNEAMNFLGALPNDVQDLSKATFERSLEKLEMWYKNGGEDLLEEQDNYVADAKEIGEDKISSVENKAKLDNEIKIKLEEAALLKNQVLDLLAHQGKYLEERETKKPSLDIKL